MTVRFRLLVREEVLHQKRMLELAAKAQPHSLRDRELGALNAGLRILAEGREADFDGARLGYSPRHSDLRDCAEIKLAVIPESRYGNDLGPSHRLIYREFEPGADGIPVRQVICFEARRDDRPFEVAGARLGRAVGRRAASLRRLPNEAPAIGTRPAPRYTSPPRLPLPPELRTAIDAARIPPPAQGAAVRPTAVRERPAPRSPSEQARSR